MMAWIRFILAAGLLLMGLFSFFSAVRGAWRFGFVLNRMHAAGIGDTLGLACVIGAAMLSSGWNLVTAKLALVVALLWLTGPVSSHFLSQIEYYTNPDLYEEAQRDESPVEEMGGGEI